ncbi:MAG: hypothetical protein QNJ44_12030 [Rhodobacter sp.]|nr:hypothetical protein [Rhodobacter sp.]
MAKMTIKTDSRDPCCCPVCTGLQTAERPLFGTGQTLTAADLTALQDYVLKKNRLHNRLQHGWGVVCGLEVFCHDCEGSVTIRPGYAIDPCGDDIVVTDSVRFDVIEAIRDCLHVQRKRGDDCDPWVPPRDEGCDEVLSHWCIALRYREVETAVGQRLTTGGVACETIGKGMGSGGCSCGGDCGCGGGSSCCGKCCSARTPAVAEYRPTTLTASNACAPRRIRECFDVTLIPRKDPCRPRMPEFRDPQGSESVGLQSLGLIGWLIPEKSLLRNIIECVLRDVAVVTNALTAEDNAVFAQLATQTPTQLAAGSLQLDAVHAAICRARGAILEALQNDRGTTRCQLLRATADVTLPPPARDANNEITEDRAEYFDRAKQRSADLVAAWAQAILDCICTAFLPRCPEDPCDDRVEIACVSVQGGKILSICNHTCRKYAGAFPSTFYWMSLVPVIPLFAKLLAMLCCQPDLLRRNSPLVNDLMPLLDRIDPTGNLRREVVKDDFAAPRRLAAMAVEFSKAPAEPTVVSQIERAVTALVRPPADEAGTTDETEKPDMDELHKELAALRADVDALKAVKDTGKTGTAPRSKAATKAKPGARTSRTSKPRKG